MSYAGLVQSARRQAILLVLYFAPGYQMPPAAIREQVERTGYVTSHDLLATEVAWLAEQGLVKQHESGAVELTARGEDVALGRVDTPGVRKPSPGETHGPR